MEIDMNRNSWAPTWAVIGLGLMAAFGGFARAEETTRAIPTSMHQIELSFADVVRKAAPAVVNIYSKRTVRTAFSDDMLFKKFFGGGGGGRERVQSALGSGVIVRADGIIVTNHHVIDGADEIVVALADRREFEAKVILDDERTDLAVLRVNTGGKSLPYLTFHDSDAAEVGDLVLAIGNPFGVGQTVTSGIISATARTQAGINDYGFFIQTDAAINPGNSGGALLTVDGKLVGINTAIYSRSGGSIGIGFAIPSNMVKVVVDTAAGGGRQLARPWLSMDVQDVTAEMAQTLGLERPVGVIVKTLAAGGPAQQAGLERGDVITKIDTFEVSDVQTLRFRAATKGVGGSVTLTYLRGGETRTANFKLVRPVENPPRHLTAISGRNPLQGATVANLSPAYAEELQVDETSGVIVVELSRRSIAARLGVRPGDIILEVNNRKITSVDALKEAVKQTPRTWDLAVNRHGQTLRVSISD
ncbi:MAG: Do family serine endopeptidase [Alphaproteobacteria bacterium]|nr:Do family serine endopeptidase [Alphaproteobacteria bacterium]